MTNDRPPSLRGARSATKQSRNPPTVIAAPAADIPPMSAARVLPIADYCVTSRCNVKTTTSMAKTTKTQRTQNEVLSDILIDLGKLVFGGIIIAGIFESEFNRLAIISAGLACFAVMMTAGIYLAIKK